MQQSVLEMAKDIVKALIQTGQLTPDDMPKALQDTFASLKALQVREGRIEADSIPVTGSPSETGAWRKSITRYAITCLECGAVYKQLSIRHLREHDLNPRSYRAKYNIPRTLPLAARDTTDRRRKAVQKTRPWEKTPRYLATQTETAAKRSGQTRNR